MGKVADRHLLLPTDVLGLGIYIAVEVFDVSNCNLWALIVETVEILLIGNQAIASAIESLLAVNRSLWAAFISLLREFFGFGPE